MRNRFIHLMNSPASELSMLVIILSMVINALAPHFFINWVDVVLIANIAAGAVLIGWLSWCTYILAKQKLVRQMRPKTRIVIESINRLLLLVWLYMAFGYIVAAIWLTFIVWSGYISIKEVLSHTS